MKDILKDTGWKIKSFIGSGNSIYIAVIKKDWIVFSVAYPG